MNSNNIELRWKQAIIGPNTAIKNLEIAVKDINWLLEENRKKDEEIQELRDIILEYGELIDWLRK